MEVDLKKVAKQLEKLNFAKIGGSYDSIKFPLEAIPPKPTKLHSPRIGKAHSVPPFDKSKLLEKYHELLEVTMMVKNGEYPIQFVKKYWPKQWGEFDGVHPELFKTLGLDVDNPRACALSVQMDHPLDLAIYLFKDINSRNNLIELKKPKVEHNHVEFLETHVHSWTRLTEEISKRMEECFEAKYYYGTPRPEEIYNFMTGLPAYQSTAYLNGCPRHGAYPSGHATYAGVICSWFQNEWFLPMEEIDLIRKASFLWGPIFRSLAFVHWPEDGVQGYFSVGKGH